MYPAVVGSHCFPSIQALSKKIQCMCCTIKQKILHVFGYLQIAKMEIELNLTPFVKTLCAPEVQGV